VQDAKCQAVFLQIGTACLVPADVGGVEGDGHRAEPHVEPADGTAVLVGGQHPQPELRVAFLRSGFVRAEGEADCVQDVLVDGVREVALQQPGRDLRDEAGVGAEGGLNLGRKAACRVFREEVAFLCVGAALPRRQRPSGVATQTLSFCSRRNGYSG
jgi:hypothetical protein